MTPTRNPADATTRNVRAAHKRDTKQNARIARIEKALALIVDALHFSNGVKFDRAEFQRALDAPQGE